MKMYVRLTNPGDRQPRQKMMPAGGQTEAFPPIGGLCQRCTVTHPHKHLCTLPPQED